MIRDLSRKDFVTPGLSFQTDGTLVPADRPTFVEHDPGPEPAIAH